MLRSSGRGSLWRVPASGAGEPAQLPFSVGEASSPAISRTGNRLAYKRETSTRTYGVFRCRAREWPVAPQRVSFPPPARIWLHNTLPTASESSLNPTAVESMASGSAMRTAPTPWNCFPGRARVAGTARWSPDGQRIAFDFSPEGNFDIYVIRASGGKPMPLTTDSGDDMPRAGREMASGSTLHLNGPVDLRCGRYRPEAERLFR